MRQIKTFFILSALLICFPSKSNSYSLPNTQPDFIITEDTIKNAVPTPAKVVFDEKTEHDVKTMEKRHFNNTTEYESDKYRIIRLEKHLLGRTWEFSPLSDRIRRLKLASQRRMLSGVSLPPGIKSYMSPSRIKNDSTPTNDTDENVGIFDGLLKLYKPDIYRTWSERKKYIEEAYGDD